MTVADWESPATQAVHYVAARPDGRCLRIVVDRGARRVIVDIVQN
jgi:deoxycytidylate deaminase